MRFCRRQGPGGPRPRTRAGVEALADTPAVSPEFEGQCNFMTPESRITRTGQDRFRPNFNAQIVVDANSQLIVATAIALLGSDQS